MKNDIEFYEFGKIEVIAWFTDHKTKIMAKYGSKRLFNISIPRITLNSLKQSAKEKFRRLVDVTTRRKVYYYHSGRDCDGVEYGKPMVFDNIFEAETYIEKSYEWADGAMYFSRMTKKEYKSAESYQRDLYAEMMNY